MTETQQDWDGLRAAARASQSDPESAEKLSYLVNCIRKARRADKCGWAFISHATQLTGGQVMQLAENKTTP